MKKLTTSMLSFVFLFSGMAFGSNSSSSNIGGIGSSIAAGGNLKLEIIDMGDPNDKPIIQCIVTGETCTIVTSK